jgi:hypothetical protein
MSFVGLGHCGWPTILTWCVLQNSS